MNSKKVWKALFKQLVPKYKVGQKVTIVDPYNGKGWEFVSKGTKAEIFEISIEQPTAWFSGYIWYFIKFQRNTRWGLRESQLFFTDEDVANGYISVP